MAELTISSDEIRSAIANYTSSYSAAASREEVGVVISAADGIANVSGLPSVMANELLEFPGGVIGVAQNLDTDSIGVVVLGNFESLAEGDEVKRTGEVLSIPVGEDFLGRVINPWANQSMVWVRSNLTKNAHLSCRPLAFLTGSRSKNQCRLASRRLMR